jgi:hypothetical protein
MSMKVILIGAIVILALPFIVLGALALFAGLSLGALRQQADGLRLAQPGADASGGPVPDAEPHDAEGA